ncbi:carbohydrate ABC transporter permease [Microbacterium sp. zg.Y1090]|uniref:carbohydrate ABC transporter permease n=1 Tax=Microbacterium TaxID=33882 RepID=UPI00214AB5F0|nr:MULTISPECIES: carbohydrate ABC transporter permease [unclassified Microbacterium]MCR2811753.1 carbohydrate ABC transporter permease [Microbacterium sp. zg.Y1084]MCR2818809.1 carbohydrate ABC transporter permease [Microbacterium sp. zg.Y1090]MDL5486900.1 carbohydrate ABC transporter permease [Microbacterium sp. zg-Y1211]WIM27123.1 carbohydrate ABC transporter permease [Microbacterium sp. zg-Y1090]
MSRPRSPLAPSRAAITGRFILIGVALVISIGPVVYGFLLSLRPYSAIVQAPLDLLPSWDELDFSAYSTAMLDQSQGGFGLGRFVLNSLVVAAATVVLSIIVSILGAYAAARLRYRGRNVVNAIILGIYLFPGIVLSVPLFVLLARAGLTGSLVGLFFVYVATTVPVSIYMMRNYFLALPESIEEAATIDGATLPQMLRSVVLPVALPGVVATAIYVFMIAWNEYFYALLFLVQDRALWTAPLGISQLADFNVPVSVLLAGSIAVTVPIVILFFVAQRYLVDGLTSGAEK